VALRQFRPPAMIISSVDQTSPSPGNPNFFSRPGPDRVPHKPNLDPHAECSGYAPQHTERVTIVVCVLPLEPPVNGVLPKTAKIPFENAQTFR
jgi:hypothetical protein